MKVQQSTIQPSKHPFTFNSSRILSQLGKLCFASTLTVAVLSVANAETTNQDAMDKEPATITKRMFDRIDGNKNQKVDWTELKGTYQTQLERVSWNEETVLDHFDTNSNDLLELEEFSNFVAGLRSETLRQSGTMQTGNASDNTPPSSADDTDNESVSIAQHEPHYTTVDEASTSNITKKEEPRRHDYTKDANATTRVEQGQLGNNMSTQPENDMTQSDNDMSTQPGHLSSGGDVQDNKLVDLNGSRVDKEKIKGAEVKNLNNQKLGVVDEVIMTATGEVTGVVVEVGGIIGIGEKPVFVNVSKLKVQGEEVIWETYMDEDTVKSLPEYDEELVSSVTNQ